MSGAQWRGVVIGAKRKTQARTHETQDTLQTRPIGRHEHNLVPQSMLVYIRCNQNIRSTVHVHMYNEAGAALHACKLQIAPRDVLAQHVNTLVELRSAATVAPFAAQAVLAMQL